MIEVVHNRAMSSGVRIHWVEPADGPTTGPAVVLIHGFPESWYSWRHQFEPLAEAGYRAIAIDVRGYGRSGAPVDVEAYAMTALVGDVIAVIDQAVGEDETAVIVGHDWGAPIAWNTALLRPERIRGVAGLSVPYNPRGDVKPLDALRAMAGPDQIFYIDYFQEPGVAEAEAEADLARWLQGFYFSASAEADWSVSNIAFIEPGGRLRDHMQYPDEGQMAWMTEDDFAFYVGEFERTGLTGPFNRYRNINRDWYQLAAWRHAPITAPSLFIGGDRDGPTLLAAKAIENFPTNLPGLTRSFIVDECGHWVQQEQPETTNALLLEFLAGLD
jgi:pimeloyl-ACP methyl ester carboxylesterase